jgi:hypothetical protein
MDTPKPSLKKESTIMSTNISRREFLSASAVSALMLVQPLSAMDIAVGEYGNISALVADNDLSLVMQKTLMDFQEVDRKSLLKKYPLTDVKALRSWIKKNSGQKVIGAVPCNIYPVLETLVREAKGAVLFHGRHVAAENNFSSHTFYTVPISQGASRQFVTSIAAQENHCQVREYCIGADGELNSSPQSITPASNWLEAMASILVTIANGRWQASSIEQYQIPKMLNRSKSMGSVETFVFGI